MTTAPGTIVAANSEGIGYEKNATAEILKVIGYQEKAIARFTSGWRHCRDQLVTLNNFRVISGTVPAITS